MKIAVIGGCGFIGTNLVYYLTEKYPQYELAVIDGNFTGSNRALLENRPQNLKYVLPIDIRHPLFKEGESFRGMDVIINLAAESHVDRSIENPHAFLETNILGLQNILEGVRRMNVPRLVHVSSDEVYGDMVIEGTAATETWNLNPSSPYSVSKAAGDLLIHAYQRTYGIPGIIIRPSNNYGPYQYPEKLIPKAIKQFLQDQPFPLYGAGTQRRDWLYVGDTCRAIDLVLHHGDDGEIYNLGGGCERKNIYVLQAILKRLGKPLSLIQHAADRPGHDGRYAVNYNKISHQLGWYPEMEFERGIARTVDWYLENQGKAWGEDWTG